jgi:hypothetical protein
MKIEQKRPRRSSGTRTGKTSSFRSNNERIGSSIITTAPHQKMTGRYEAFPLVGKKLDARYVTSGAMMRLPYGLYFVREKSGNLVKRINGGEQ